MYADDGLLYSDTAIDIKKVLSFSPESGIKVNWSKSEYVRKEGEWLKPLKFLGMEYEFQPGEGPTIHNGGTLSNATRTPKPFLIDYYHAIQEAAEYDRQFYPKRGRIHPDSWSNVFQSAYAGMVTSHLYNGTKEVTLIKQDFSYRFKR